MLLVAEEGAAGALSALLHRLGCALDRRTDRTSLARLAAHYAMIILALAMAPDDAANACEEIRRASPHTCIVLATDGSAAGRVLEAAPDELLLPGDPPEVVRWRLERALARSRGGVLRWGPIEVDTARGETTVSGQPCTLTGIQYRLLVLLLERAGGFVSNEEIVHKAMGVVAAANPRTPVHELRQALGPAGELIRNKRGRGYYMTSA